MRALLLVVALAGCSKILGIDDLKGGGKTDGGAGSDSGPADVLLPDVTVAGNIKVSGTVTTIDATAGSRSPVPNMPLELRTLPGDVLITGGVTDPNGQFALTVATNGMPVSAYLYVRGTTINCEDAYYFMRPLTADTAVTNLVLAQPQTINLLAQISGAPAPNPQNALVFTFVVRPDNTGQPGVVVQTEPNTGAVRYFDAAGSAPNASLTSTTESGIAVVFDVPPLQVHFRGVLPGRPLAMYDLTAKPMTTNYLPLVIQ